MVIRPRNGLSLCAGAGGLDMGLMLAEPGFHTRCFVEWEQHPRDTIIAAQRAGYFAPAPIWDDVTTFDGTRYRGAIDTVLAGYPCFVAGTIICTKRGHIPIEQVAVGDFVLTHKGRWRPVTARMGKSDAPVRQIKAQGVPGVVCTDEHPFYVEGGEWVAAQHLGRGERVGQVLPPVIADDRSSEFWWVIGRYLADGWRQWSPSQRSRRRGRISICCARHEADELGARIAAAGFRAYRNEERTTTRFAITRHDLYKFCGQFGEGASGKYLPGWVLGLDAERARALCEGYFSGDGYRYQNPRGEGGGWRVTTVSRGLALSFAALAQRAFGVVASIRHYKGGSERTSIEGRDVAQRDQYFLVVPDRNRSGRVDGDYAWKLVRSNQPCGTADVFNIAVEEDESYVADGAIVHNCQPFSAAGQRKGEDDERHLWPDVARIIREVEPRWVFLENVSGHVSLGLETVLRELWDMGWTPATGIFSAGETGAPHERQRVFIVAYRDRAFAGSDIRKPNAGANWRNDTGGRSRNDLAEAKRSAGHQGGASGSSSGLGSDGQAPDRFGRHLVGLFPPGPGDGAAWAETLATSPDLAPATGLADCLAWARDMATAMEGQDQAQAQSRLRFMAHGMAARSRALHLLGNGVFSLAAGHAWRTLAASHGLGALDLAASGRDRSARSDGDVLK